MHLPRPRALVRLALFSLTLLAVLPTPGPAEATTVRPDRPRIWLTRDTLARLRARAATGAVRWRSLKAVCDENMGSTSPYMTSIGNYALAYQITGNVAYADKAIELAKIQVDKGLAALQVQGTHGYEARTVLPDVSIAYDWCYDRLTPALRSRFRAQLEAWADWIWPETNPSRLDAWSINDPGDNFYHGYMMTWIVGLALSGDSSKAQGYLDRALSRWSQQIRPFLEKYEAGGYMLEGTSYGNGTMGRLFAYLSAHQTATGEDLLNASGFAWGRQAVLARLYQTLPERIRRYPGGDQPRVGTAPIDDYDRTALLVAMNHVDPTTGGYARWWLDNVTPNQDQWRWMQWEEMLWYRDDIPAVDYRQVLPTGYWASGAGWMTSRSDWGPDATYVAMNCGPFRQSHQDKAQNDFMIYRKEWLAASARLAGGDGILRDTEFHNTLTIGGLQQPEVTPGLPQDSPRVLNFADTERYAYFVGEAADAYAYWKWPSAIPVLNSFRRHLLHLKPNRVVIFDRVDAVDASKVKKWHLNTLTEPVVSGAGYWASAGGSTLYGQMLRPRGASIQKVPLFLGSGRSLSSWRLDIAAPTGQRLDTFLNVLEVAPSGQGSPASVFPVSAGRDDLIGAQIGQQSVLFDASSAPSYPITYSLNAPAALEHFVLNQKPGEWYQVEAQDAGGAPLHQQRVQATDQGVLVFSITAPGATRIALRPETSGTPAPPGGSSTGGSGSGGSTGGSGAGGGSAGGGSTGATVPAPPDPNMPRLTLTIDPKIGTPGTLVRVRARVQVKGVLAVGAKVLFEVRTGGRLVMTRTYSTNGVGDAILFHSRTTTGVYTVTATATVSRLPQVTAQGTYTIQSRTARRGKKPTARLARRARPAATECKVLR